MEENEYILDGIFENIKYSLDKNGNFELSLKQGTNNTDMPIPNPDVFAGDYWPWSDYRDKIINLRIADEITKITEWAFWNCPNLTTNGLSEYSQCRALISNAISYCNIKTFYIPQFLTEIPDECLDRNQIEKFEVHQDNEKYLSHEGFLCEKRPLKNGGFALKGRKYPQAKKDPDFLAPVYTFSSKCFCGARYLERIYNTNSEWIYKEYGATATSQFTTFDEESIVDCDRLRSINIMNPYEYGSVSKDSFRTPFGKANSVTQKVEEYHERYDDIPVFVTTNYLTLYVYDEVINPLLDLEKSFNDEQKKKETTDIRKDEELDSYYGKRQEYRLSVSFKASNPSPEGGEQPEWVQFTPYGVDEVILTEQALSSENLQYRVIAQLGVWTYDVTASVEAHWSYNNGEISGKSFTGLINIDERFEAGNTVKVTLSGNLNGYDLSSVTPFDIKLIESYEAVSTEVQFNDNAFNGYQVKDYFKWTNSFKVLVTYSNGQVVDRSGSAAKGIYDPNGKELLVNSEDGKYYFKIPGIYTLKISYSEVDRAYTFKVTQNFLGIGIKTLPTKINYIGNYTKNSKEVNLNTTGLVVALYWGKNESVRYNPQYLYQTEIETEECIIDPTKVSYDLSQSSPQRKEITIKYYFEQEDKTFTTSFFVNLIQSTEEWQWTQLYDYPDGSQGFISKEAYIPIKDGALCPITADEWNGFLKKLRDLKLIREEDKIYDVVSGDDFSNAFTKLHQIMWNKQIGWPDFYFGGETVLKSLNLEYSIFNALEQFVNKKIQENIN